MKVKIKNFDDAIENARIVGHEDDICVCADSKFDSCFGINRGWGFWDKTVKASIDDCDPDMLYYICDDRFIPEYCVDEVIYG